MARIRALKIGFFRDEDLCGHPFAHRLLFAGLWVLADREGRLEDKPKQIHADLFPFDASVDVDAMLADLASGPHPFILRYDVGGRRFLSVINFQKHQRPHTTEAPSILPAADDPSAQLSPRAPLDNVKAPLSQGGATLDLDLDQGKDLDHGKGKGEGSARRPPRPAASASDLMALWNDRTTAPIAKVLELTDKRRKSAIARLHERPLDQWLLVIDRIARSGFCRGENDRGWTASFDWLLRPDTAVRVLEGRYDDRRVPILPQPGKGARNREVFHSTAKAIEEHRRGEDRERPAERRPELVSHRPPGRARS